MPPETNSLNQLTQWLASVKLGWVIIFCIFLFVLRYILRRKSVYESEFFAEHKWFRKNLVETVEAALFAIALVAFIIRPFFVQAFFIPSGSMMDTLDIQDRIAVNKLAYKIHKPRFGDIVVFSVEQEEQPGGQVLDAGQPIKHTFWGFLFGEKFPQGVQRRDFIKRCMAVPGDEMLIADETVWRNGKALDEPYTRETPDYDLGTWDESVFSDLGPMVGPEVKEFVTRCCSPDDYVNIEYSHGMVFINGKTLGPDDSEIVLENRDVLKLAPYKIPKDHLLMLGDNRRESNDGHVWGVLDESRVVGRAWFVFWPPRRYEGWNWRSLSLDWKKAIERENRTP
jgi:signal peptidase I